MINIIYILVLFVSAWIFSFIGSALLVYFLPRLGWFDVPVDRSNHQAPTPRGGGIAVSLAATAFLLTAGADAHMAWAAIFLAIVSLIDDVKGLAIRPRLAAQFLAIAYGYYALADHSISQGLLPLWAEAPLVALAWVWFINLYNFMDGIDGITVAQTTSLSVGIFVLGMITTEVTAGMQADAAIVAAAVLGFAFFNWHPARIFMGDVGSIPLGFLMGYMLLMLAAKGEWAAALILPAYYLADATYTITRRALRGEKIWKAHSEHAFQKAVRSGWLHDEVVRWIVALNIVLVVLAAISTINFICALGAIAVAYALSFALMKKFSSQVVQVIAPEAPADSQQAAPTRQFRNNIPDTI